ncbi:UDP-glucose/GDP-mannose dehydrogenase family protein [Deferribacterales bacterium RsTz2092]|nr:UDP-glucose 6-dehydrogenase [Deferribacterales bacterium]
MNIGIIGVGYVGLPTGVGFAELGHNVICVDKLQDKVDALKAGKLTLFEEGLEDLFNKNVNAGRLSFTTSMKDAVSTADVVIIAVGTPPHPITKEADMKYIYAASSELAEHLSDYTVVATKSTVPVGIGDEIEKRIRQVSPKAAVDVISMPEFLREGFAVHDFFHPDRVIIGTNSEKARTVVEELYSVYPTRPEILYVRRRSSEIIKYASNAFLAMKIHYINEMADFCEKVGADVYEVAKGVGLDTRIGSKFLNPGPGYGGSCFPKDTNALAYMARHTSVDLSLVEATIKGNDERKQMMSMRILAAVKGVEHPKIATFGLAFKGGTDDVRESPAIEIISELVSRGSKVVAYDPKATDSARAILGSSIEYASDPYKAVEGADVLAVLTEWEEFRNYDLVKIKGLMKRANIVDLRNILDGQKAVNLGFAYKGIGR